MMRADIDFRERKKAPKKKLKSPSSSEAMNSNLISLFQASSALGSSSTIALTE
jgi:hypothetical protein